MANQHTKNRRVSAQPKPPKNPVENLPPSFTLFASDNFSTLVISYWIQLAEGRGVSKTKIDAARKRMAEIEEHRRLNPFICKLPD